MQVTETLSEGLKRGYTVVVPAADIEGRRTRRLTEIGKTLRLPGFRPGKVPMPVVKMRFGDAVNAEVLEESVNDATRQVLSDRGLRAAMQPRVDLVTTDEAKDLEFKVEVELLPDITPPDFSAISLTRMKATPAPEAIDKVLAGIADRNRDFVDVETPRPSAKGDRLTVDFVGKMEGTPFPGGNGADLEVEIGGQGFIPGFSEKLEGLSPGEARTIEVTFPEQYGARELAGKAATFDVTAKKLKAPVVPPVDDALAEKLGFENLEKLREAITAQIQREYDQLARLRIKRQLLDALAGAVSFPVPEGMVQAEFDQIWQRVEASRQAGEIDEDDKGKDDDTLKAEYRAIAERRVRLGLLLAEIGRVNGMAVSPDEMTRAMRAEASRYPGREAQVMEYLRKNPQAAEGLRAPIFEEKVVDFVLELAKVTDAEVTAEELARDPDAKPTETAPAPEPAAAEP
jgi:trigger factor